MENWKIYILEVCGQNSLKIPLGFFVKFFWLHTFHIYPFFPILNCNFKFLAIFSNFSPPIWPTSWCQRQYEHCNFEKSFVSRLLKSAIWQYGEPLIFYHSYDYSIEVSPLMAHDWDPDQSLFEFAGFNCYITRLWLC